MPRPLNSARSHGANGQFGQSMVEFALSSVVLLLLVGGLVDIGRAVYIQEVLSGAAREGVRHGVWFDAPQVAHTYLDDVQIQAAVNAQLTSNSLPAAVLQNPTPSCPVPTDGNAQHNPPYPNSAYPAAANQTWLYICYDNNAALDYTTIPATTLSQRDLNVIVLYTYGPLTPIITAQFGTFHLAANMHMTVQGP
ncbi:MAG TPA: TadE/TadG family type IV pilus assembly protein [Candidatus Dormibacteraeota bacterium]|nr:TadE/TadG family type IV pilus assembly protein [Candidatus Dormibacteraeota bacterium]